MKKTISITLNGIVFNIEEDAYERLNAYLESLKHHFGDQEYGKEVVNDIESRISEQFSSKMSDRKTEVITLVEIEEIIKTMGTVADLSADTKRMESEAPSAAKRRLYRNPDDQVIAGVSGGIASYFNIDPIIPRLLFVVFALAGGYGILLYLILWIIVPEAQTSAEKLEMKGNAVTVANLEESRKEKKDGKNFSIIRYFFREVFYLLGRFFKTLGPIVLTVIGLFATAVAFVGIFAISLMAVILIFNPNSPYIDPTIAQIFNNSQYAMLIISGYVALIIPALTALLIGISFVRKKNVLNTAVGVTFVVLWLAGALTFGGLASNAAPQIQAAVQTLENTPDSSREYQVSGFDSIRADQDHIVKIRHGAEQKVVVYGPEEQLEEVQINARNRVLSISQDDRDFQICLICYHRPLTIEITTPNLNTIESNGASSVEISGFETLDVLRLEANGAGQISFDGKAEQVLADSSHASKIDLVGSANILNATLTGASRINAESFTVNIAEIDATHSSTAEVSAAQRIVAEASGASRVNYTGNPTEEILDMSGAGRIIER